MAKAVKVKLADLVLDYNLYPRSMVDGTHVHRLVAALEAGERLPPVAAERCSMRVVDGFHRVLAYRRLKLAEIDVGFQNYANDRELFATAARLNARHGHTLSTFDLVRCISKLVEFRMPKGEICSTLGMNKKRLAALILNRIAKRNGKPHPVKRSFGRLAGHELSEAQAEANRRSSGMNHTFYVNQLIDLIEAGVVDWENVAFLARVRRLHELLDAKVGVVV